MPFYAVAKGRNPGIYMTWNECKAQVDHFSGPKFKKFPNKSEAEDFIKQNGGPSNIPTDSNPNSVFVSKFQNSKNKRTRTPDSSNFTKRRKTELIDFESCIPKTDSNGFIVDENGFVNVFTDGACSQNGKKKAKAGIGVWFADENPLNVSKAVIGRQTNNMAEIQAVTSAALQAQKAGITKLKINTDSQFLINCITKWMKRWKKKGWKTAEGHPVINKAELLEMEAALKPLEIIWNHVRGHAGIYGNEMADKLAREGAEKN